MNLSLAILQRMWPHGNSHVPGLLEGIATKSEEVFAKYGLTTSLVVAHAIGQFSEECGAGLEMVENMNYTAQRLREVFPTHFSPSLAARAAHNPRMVADIAYGGRMGNAPPPSDDGWNYRGRGLSQVTGRDGYTALGKKIEHDLIADPDLVNDPELVLECGVADWVLCGCLPFAERDDTLGETRKLNGGTNGLSDRRMWIARWKRTLDV